MKTPKTTVDKGEKFFLQVGKVYAGGKFYKDGRFVFTTGDMESLQAVMTLFKEHYPDYSSNLEDIEASIVAGVKKQELAAQ